MIIQFPNGAGVDSRVIASIYVEKSYKDTPARIIVYVFRGDGMTLNPWNDNPKASYLFSIPMASDAEAYDECRKIVDQWAQRLNESVKHGH
jgi:hypothetical protein